MPRCFQFFRFLRAESRFDDFIVERKKLPIGAGVALPAAAADELPIDALRFVQLGADDVQAAKLVDAFAEADVGTAAGHVRGDRDFALLAGLRNDFGFLRDVPCVQHRMFDAALHQQPREHFAFIDRPRADEHGPAQRDAARAGPQ